MRLPAGLYTVEVAEQCKPLNIAYSWWRWLVKVVLYVLIGWLALEAFWSQYGLQSEIAFSLDKI